MQMMDSPSNFIHSKRKLNEPSLKISNTHFLMPEKKINDFPKKHTRVKQRGQTAENTQIGTLANNFLLLIILQAACVYGFYGIFWLPL